MEVKKTNLFDLFKDKNNITDNYFSDLELKYIKQLCPIIEQRILEANSFYSKYKASRPDMSSLAKELGVSRPTLYKKAIVQFVDFCKCLFPGSYSTEEIKRLTQQVNEKENRLKAFRLKDYNIEELEIRCMSSDKTIQEQKIRIKNLEKKILELRNENASLKKQFGIKTSNPDAIRDRHHIEIDVVNGHIKKGTKITGEY